MNTTIEGFFDEGTSTISYVVFDAGSHKGVVIDPVWDFDINSGRTSTTQADKIIAYVEANTIKIEWILETHAHADHLSAAQYLKRRLNAKIGIGANITTIQKTFQKVFNLEAAFDTNGNQFDRLLSDGDEIIVGNMRVTVLSVPGHTPADVAYKVGNNLFVGDTLFMPDTGTARCDFPGGNAHQLYQSIRRLLSFDESTTLYLCHDYPPTQRAPQWRTTVAEQRRANIHVRDGISEAEFIAMRTTRDASLEMPLLLIPSVQVNIRAGQLPPAEQNGQHYLKTPINVI